MSAQKPHGGSFQEVRSKKTGRLLLKFDAARDIVHIADRRRGIDEEVDLHEYRSSFNEPTSRTGDSTDD